MKKAVRHFDQQCQRCRRKRLWLPVKDRDDGDVCRALVILEEYELGELRQSFSLAGAMNNNGTHCGSPAFRTTVFPPRLERLLHELTNVCPACGDAILLLVRGRYRICRSAHATDR